MACVWWMRVTQVRDDDSVTTILQARNSRDSASNAVLPGTRSPSAIAHPST